MKKVISNKKYKDVEESKPFREDPDAIPKARQDLRNLIYLIVITMALYIISVMLIDPYKVYNIANFNKRNFELSTRYNAIEFLKQNPKQGFILGNSRANGFPVNVAEELTGQQFYNLQGPGDTMYGIISKLNWLLNNQPVKTIILSLDAGSLEGRVKKNPQSHIYIEHPDVSGENYFNFFWRFLWVPPKVHAITIYGNILRRSTWWRWDNKTGHYHLVEKEHLLAHDIEKAASINRKRRKKIYKRIASRKPYRINPEKMELLSDAVEKAKNKKINLIVVLISEYPDYDDLYTSNYNAARLAIASAIPKFWDFSRLVPVVCGYEYWFDSSHFSFKLGEAMLYRILSSESSSGRKYASFGKIVDQQPEPQRLDDCALP